MLLRTPPPSPRVPYASLGSAGKCLLFGVLLGMNAVLWRWYGREGYELVTVGGEVRDNEETLMLMGDTEDALSNEEYLRISNDTSVPVSPRGGEPPPKLSSSPSSPASKDLRKLYDTIASQTVFWIMASKTSDPSIVRSTWGKYVDASHIVFIGKCDACTFDVDLTTHDGRIVPERPETLWVKTRSSLIAIAKRYPRANYFVKLDMDTYVVPENLLYEMIRIMFPPQRASDGSLVFPAPQPSGPSRAFYFGSAMNQLKRIYASGGAGYVVTRSAMEVTQDLSKTSECRKFKIIGGFEDMYLGDCMRTSGVPFIESKAFNAYTWSPNFPHTEYPATLHHYKSKELFYSVHTTVRTQGFVLGGSFAGKHGTPRERFQWVKKSVKIFDVDRGWM